MATTRTTKAKPAAISLRSYARHRGVSLTAVQKAIDDGRLSVSVTTVNGVRKITDPQQADKEWEQNTDGDHHSASGNQNDEIAQLKRQAQAMREKYAAATAKLDYEEKVGKLVNADQVRMVSFNAARKARDKLMTIADRIAPLFPDIAHELHTAITEEVERVCRELANVKGY